MCDSDKEDSFTISHALKALDEGEDQEGYKYFQERGWLDRTNNDINNRKWTEPDLYKRLLRLYSKKVKQVHPDKGGSKASTDTFMLVKKGWDMLKKCHSRIIDLTQDSDDDIDDLDDPSSVDDGLSDDAKQNESEGDDENGEENVRRAITSHSRTTDNSSEHDAEEDESDRGEHREHDGGQHVVTRGDHQTTNTASELHGATGDIHAGGTAPSQCAYMLGGSVPGETPIRSRAQSELQEKTKKRKRGAMEEIDMAAFFERCERFHGLHGATGDIHTGGTAPSKFAGQTPILQEKTKKRKRGAVEEIDMVAIIARCQRLHGLL